MDILNAVFRWMHVLMGIIWIGLLYFFNFVNGPFVGTLDGDAKKKVVPELMPRALFWFRWGAAWTWFTGILLLALVFYHDRQIFAADAGWSAGAFVMVAIVFLAPFIYDALMKSALAKNIKVAYTIGFILTALIIFLMVSWGNFSYRAFNIHTGTMFGTIMAFNVWFRIWPAQRQIITAVKNGTAPDPAVVAIAGSRSRHNTYMSVPLLWTMINQHTTSFAGEKYGISGQFSWLVLLVVILIGWHLVFHLYKKAGKIKGF